MRVARLKTLYSLLTFLLVLFLSPLFARAGTEHNLVGYAWSSTVGWISFNCTDDNSCGTADYGVNLNGDGTMVGYAWSPNIGWVKFGGLAGFPAGNGNQAQNANVNGNNVKGWARVCGGYSDTAGDPAYPNQTVANNTCGGTARTDGWDGWLALAGSSGSGSYKVSYDGTYFIGYAWGGPVVGWVMFDPQSTGACTNCGVRLSTDASLDVQSGGLSIVGQSAVPYGTIPTFVWTVTNFPGGASCSVSKTSSGGTSFTTINGIVASGSTAGSALVNATYTYQISCSGGGLTPISKQVSFTVAPQPAGFTIGPDATAHIQFLGTETADSEGKSVYVSPSGNFAAPVSVSITGFPTAPAGTTFTYSLNGSTFSANPGSVTLNSPYAASATFKMRISKPVTASYNVTLTGTSSGYPDSTKMITVTPTSFSPQFNEF